METEIETTSENEIGKQNNNGKPWSPNANQIMESIMQTIVGKFYPVVRRPMLFA